MTNPFHSTERWDVQTERILGDGNHVVRIDEADVGLSKNGFCQLTLRMSNEHGVITDWMVITEATAGKIVALAESTSVRLPDDDDVASDPFGVTQAYADLFFAKTVGIVVRDEPRRDDPSKISARVQGYVEPERIKASPASNSGAFQPAAKSDYPF